MSIIPQQLLEELFHNRTSWVLILIFWSVIYFVVWSHASNLSTFSGILSYLLVTTCYISLYTHYTGVATFFLFLLACFFITGPTSDPNTLIVSTTIGALIGMVGCNLFCPLFGVHMVLLLGLFPVVHFCETPFFYVWILAFGYLMSGYILVVTTRSKIKLMNTKFDNLFSSAFEAFVILDEHHCIYNLNPSFVTFFDCPREFAIGHPFSDFIDPENHPTFQKWLLHPTLPLELTARRPLSGSKFSIKCVARPFWVSGTTEFLICISDLTPFKENEINVRALRMCREFFTPPTPASSRAPSPVRWRDSPTPGEGVRVPSPRRHLLPTSGEGVRVPSPRGHPPPTPGPGEGVRVPSPRRLLPPTPGPGGGVRVQSPRRHPPPSPGVGEEYRCPVILNEAPPPTYRGKRAHSGPRWDWHVTSPEGRTPPQSGFQ